VRVNTPRGYSGTDEPRDPRDGCDPQVRRIAKLLLDCVAPWDQPRCRTVVTQLAAFRFLVNGGTYKIKSALRRAGMEFRCRFR
jgi:hypothetical protein